MMLRRQKFLRPLDNGSHINPQVPGSSPGRGANPINTMRPIPAFRSTHAVYENVAKNPQVDTIRQRSFADIQEFAVVTAVAPHSHRSYM
jgi:hypothetical protein